MENLIQDAKKYKIDVVKHRWHYLLISAILIIPGIIAMLYSMITYPSHLPLKIGIDYTGGTILQYTVDREVPLEEMTKLRTTIEEKGIESPMIQILKSSNLPNEKTDKNKSVISIRTKFLEGTDNADKNQITTIIKDNYPEATLVGVQSIGPTLGKELLFNSMIALLLAFVGIVAYLSIRFQLDYAIFAILALGHDVLFIIGMFSIFGIFFNTQIDGLFMTAILTGIGFSVHDTIVVYDRIRENVKLHSKKMSFNEIVNFSISQTLMRSINTSLTTLLTLLALYLFGGVTTKDFVMAMLLGIIIGTYSSIFFASTVLTWHREAEQKRLKKA